MYVPHILYAIFGWGGHLGCFHVLNIMDNAAMNIGEQVFLWYDWASFAYMPKSGVAGSSQSISNKYFCWCLLCLPLSLF